MGNSKTHPSLNQLTYPKVPMSNTLKSTNIVSLQSALIIKGQRAWTTIKASAEEQRVLWLEVGVSTIKQRGNALVDTKSTASLARQFAATSPADRVDSDKYGRSLAASLITMGEGVVTHAYDDPAQGAGRNIGTGYNLKANAENAASDLRRAGVPSGSVQGVIDGTLQMTSDQVSRLTQLSIQKYEAIAKDTAEKSAPGLWAKMTAPQKAVMMDVAYQVGSVDKFRNAWKALASGDTTAFEANVATTYVNKSGERVTDKRRTSLRASMLAGSSTWDATVNKYGSYPSTALDVASLNSD